MPSAFDLYTFYLEPSDLKSQTHRVKIASAKAEPVFDPITKRDQQKIVLRFEQRKKIMPLNKTQVGALIEIAGTDDYTKWPGTEVLLTASIASNKKETITITADPPTAPKETS